MIARLKGTLVERSADAVIIDCGGVGYEVSVPLSTLSAMPEPGHEVVLRVYTHVQETRIALYGFLRTQERELFDRLITVKNIGPATAVEVLSGTTSPEDLARLIAAGDAAALTRIRGVGKKRADLLVVELREKCQTLLASWGASGGDSGRERPALLDDVASALVHMGWRQAEAEKVIGKLEIPLGATVESLLREALRGMPR